MKFQEVTDILKGMGGWYKYQARRVVKTPENEGDQSTVKNRTIASNIPPIIPE